MLDSTKERLAHLIGWTCKQIANPELACIKSIREEQLETLLRISRNWGNLSAEDYNFYMKKIYWS